MTDVIETVVDTTNKAPDGAIEPKKYDEEYVNTVKAESIARGKKLKEVEDKLKKFEDEKLTESEKDKKKITDLEAEKLQILNERKEEKIDNLILKKSTGKNIVDIDALMMFAKKELASIENVDDKAVEGVVNKILKDKPYLINSTNVNPGDGNFAKPSGDPIKDANASMVKFLQS